MTARVYHAIHPTFGHSSSDNPEPVWPNGYKHVADIFVNRSACLDDIFRLTNNIDNNWQDNKDKDIEWSMPGSRSTSVGDIIELDGKFFKVQYVGFEELRI